jgi:hypothetical protein
MPTDTSQPRLTKRCVAVMTKAINAFPDVLAGCDDEVAAAIIADLIKYQLSNQQEEQEESLESILKRAAIEAEEEYQATHTVAVPSSEL